MRWFQCWIRLQNKAVLISTTPYVSNCMVNAGQSQHWLEWKSQSCCHFGWSLPNRLSAQPCVCFLLNHFAFYTFFVGIMARNLQEQILVRIVTLLTEVYSQLEGARMSGVSQGCVRKNSNATETLVGYISGGVEVGGVWPQPEKTNSWTEWSGTNIWCRLLVCALRWCADFGGGCQFGAL